MMKNFVCDESESNESSDNLNPFDNGMSLFELAYYLILFDSDLPLAAVIDIYT